MLLSSSSPGNINIYIYTTHLWNLLSVCKCSNPRPPQHKSTRRRRRRRWKAHQQHSDQLSGLCVSLSFSVSLSLWLSVCVFGGKHSTKHCGNLRKKQKPASKQNNIAAQSFAQHRPELLINNAPPYQQRLHHPSSSCPPPQRVQTWVNNINIILYSVCACVGLFVYVVVYVAKSVAAHLFFPHLCFWCMLRNAFRDIDSQECRPRE